MSSLTVTAMRQQRQRTENEKSLSERRNALLSVQRNWEWKQLRKVKKTEHTMPWLRQRSRRKRNSRLKQKKKAEQKIEQQRKRAACLRTKNWRLRVKLSASSANSPSTTSLPAPPGDLLLRHPHVMLKHLQGVPSVLGGPSTGQPKEPSSVFQCHPRKRQKSLKSLHLPQ